MKIFLSLCLCLFWASAVNAQVLTDSILIDNHYRSFHFNKPHVKNKASLVFVLHGSGGNGLDMMKAASHMEAMGVSENFIAVYANGYLHYWNECRKASTSVANQENVDENGFFSGMITYFIQKYGIDPHRVFAVGTSGGGHMCYKLALTMPEKFKAITAIIANLPDTDNLDCIERGKALPVMIINGTADPLNKYEGGMMEWPGVKMGRVRSTERTFQYWATLAGYTQEPVKEIVPDKDPNDGKTIERYSYRRPGKPEVVLLKVIGGKHDYPNDIDVHVEAWEFFKRQP